MAHTHYVRPQQIKLNSLPGSPSKKLLEHFIKRVGSNQSSRSQELLKENSYFLRKIAPSSESAFK